MHEVNRYDFTIKQGTTSKIGFPVMDVNGEPADLSSYTAKSQVRDKLSNELLYEFITSIQGNLVIIEVDPDVSSGWTWRSGIYDIEITSPNNKARVAQGEVKVSKEVTL